MDEGLKQTCTVIVAAMIAFIIGVSIGFEIGGGAEEKKAIKAGVAYYTNSVDGDSIFKFKSHCE
jgi:hypothetical protein